MSDFENTTEVQAASDNWMQLFDRYGDHDDDCDLAIPDCSCGMRAAYRAMSQRAQAEVAGVSHEAIPPAGAVAEAGRYEGILSAVERILAEESARIAIQAAQPDAENAYVLELEARIRNLEAEIEVSRRASPAPVAVPAGYRLVPDAALTWLMGEGPDADGHWFGDNSKNKAAKGAFWWRKPLRAMLSASPAPAQAVTGDGPETDGGAV